MKILITTLETSRKLYKQKIGFFNSYNWYQICPSLLGTGLKRKYWLLGTLNYVHNITGEKIIDFLPAWTEHDLRTFPTKKVLHYRNYELTV